MKKNKRVAVCYICLFLLGMTGSGCGTPKAGILIPVETPMPTVAETPVADEIPAITEVPANNDISTDNQNKSQLTMEQIKLLSTEDTLTVQDLFFWEGLQENSLQGEFCKYYYYEFPYQENTYRLEFCVEQEEKLRFVLLVDMQTMLNIDIRTGNIDNLIANTVSMTDYLTYTLPENVSETSYDIYKPDHGGVDFIYEGEPCGGICILDNSRVNPRFADGAILRVDHYDNNIYHVEMQGISTLSVPALFSLMEVEEGESVLQYYSVYFATQSCHYCYNIRLRADLFAEEDIMTMLKTVQFSDRAFKQ